MRDSICDFSIRHVPTARHPKYSTITRLIRRTETIDSFSVGELSDPRSFKLSQKGSSLPLAAHTFVYSLIIRYGFACKAEPRCFVTVTLRADCLEVCGG